MLHIYTRHTPREWINFRIVTVSSSFLFVRWYIFVILILIIAVLLITFYLKLGLLLMKVMILQCRRSTLIWVLMMMFIIEFCIRICWNVRYVIRAKATLIGRCRGGMIEIKCIFEFIIMRRYVSGWRRCWSIRRRRRRRRVVRCLVMICEQFVIIVRRWLVWMRWWRRRRRRFDLVMVALIVHPIWHRNNLNHFLMRSSNVERLRIVLAMFMMMRGPRRGCCWGCKALVGYGSWLLCSRLNWTMWDVSDMLVGPLGGGRSVEIRMMMVVLLLLMLLAICIGWRMSDDAMISRVRRLNRNLLFDDFHNRYRNGHWDWLIDGERFSYFYDFRLSMLMFSDNSSEIHKLFARLLQVGVVAVDNKVKVRLSVWLMDTVDLVSNVSLLLLIEIMNLVL